MGRIGEACGSGKVNPKCVGTPTMGYLPCVAGICSVKKGGSCSGKEGFNKNVYGKSCTKESEFIKNCKKTKGQIQNCHIS
ncbi:MAG: hypothetical protein HOJ35_04580 [Bdellovibrionales bacterium]|jgi:hypothetical protein|nr:hypothetical protein [Bdellovibrionales bacterium]